MCLLSKKYLRNCFQGQGIEIESVTGIEVGRDGFWIVIHDDGLMAHVANSPNGMDTPVVELYSLADPDWPRTNHYNSLLGKTI